MASAKPVALFLTLNSPIEAVIREAAHQPKMQELKLGDVVALEYSPQIGRHALAHLCNYDWDEGPETLHYRWGRSLYLLYRAEAIKTRELGSRFPGVRLHTHGFLPIPPSYFGVGPQIQFARLSAPILPLPWWLYKDEQNKEFSDAA